MSGNDFVLISYWIGTRTICFPSEPANFTEAEKLLVMEPTVDAITRMAQFIGDREYKTIFLEEIKNAAQLEKLGPQL